MQFKIGDNVRVRYIDPYEGWTNGTKLIGQIGVICDIIEGDSIPVVVGFNTEMLESLLGDSNGGYAYHFKESEVESAIAVGEQLLFPFMNEVT